MAQSAKRPENTAYEQAARRAAFGRSQGAQRHLLAAAHRFALGRNSPALRTIDDLLQPFRPLGQDRRLGSDFEAISKAYDGDLQMIDSSSIRVHQHGANGKKGGLKKRHPPLGTSLEPAAWGAREAD